MMKYLIAFVSFIAGCGAMYIYLDFALAISSTRCFTPKDGYEIVGVTIEPIG
jgi:hypothetical protein